MDATWSEVPEDGGTTGEAVGAPRLPEARRIGTGLLGLVLLGAAGSVGDGGAGLSGVPAGLWSGLGALALTAPALLVAHQYLRGRAAPEAIVGALATALVRGGELCLGLVPLQLFFTCTTGRGGTLLGLLLGGVAAGALLGATRDLVDAERAGGGEGAQVATARALAAAWAGLTLLIGLRLGWGLL